jgi:hypothetical protein
MVYTVTLKLTNHYQILINIRQCIGHQKRFEVLTKYIGTKIIKSNQLKN